MDVLVALQRWIYGTIAAGKRSSVKWIRNTPTATRQWHDLKVRIAGTKLEGDLDGKLYWSTLCQTPEFDYETYLYGDYKMRWAWTCLAHRGASSGDDP